MNKIYDSAPIPEISFTDERVKDIAKNFVKGLGHVAALGVSFIAAGIGEVIITRQQLKSDSTTLPESGLDLKISE